MHELDFKENKFKKKYFKVNTGYYKCEIKGISNFEVLEGRVI